ncbi:hypothetical protein BC332_28453 [Capsicum chinense]|nr:hypothetical protein BC332_28453 [Capsicum chinense]
MPENTVRPEVKQEDYPCLYLFPHHHQFWQHSQLQNQSLLKPCEVMSSLSKSLSLSSTQQQELKVDDIEDFDDDDDLDEVDSRRYSRRVLNDAADFVLGLPPFAIGWASLSVELLQPFGLICRLFSRFILRNKDPSCHGTLTFPCHTEVPRILLFGLFGFAYAILAPFNFKVLAFSLIITENTASVLNNLRSDGAEWVELFVREMMSATSTDDARTHATRVLGS